MPKNPAGDFRMFLASLEADGDLARIARPVAPRFEVAAYVRRSCDLDGPAFCFEHIVGHPGWTVVGGTFGVVRRLLRALGCDRREAIAQHAAALARPIPPVVLPGPAPHQARRWEGDEVDLSKLPIPIHSGRDAGPYITAGVQVVRDPSGKVQQLGIHRMQVKGPRRLGFWGATSGASRVHTSRTRSAASPPRWPW